MAMSDCVAYLLDELVSDARDPPTPWPGWTGLSATGWRPTPAKGQKTWRSRRRV